MIPSTLPINEHVDGLENWRWAIPDKEIRPLILTTFGDWIYETRNDGVKLLSILDGTTQKICDSPEILSQQLKQENNRDEWFLEGFIIRCNNEGLKLELGQCLGWKLQPIIGGKFEFANINVYDSKIYWHIAAQIVKQARGIPI